MFAVEVENDARRDAGIKIFVSSFAAKFSRFRLRRKSYGVNSGRVWKQGNEGTRK